MERQEYERMMEDERLEREALEHEYEEYFTPYLMSTPKEVKLWKPNESSTAGSEKAIEAALDHMESAETERINKDLKDFQEARRRLIIDTTNIHPAKT